MKIKRILKEFIIFNGVSKRIFYFIYLFIFKMKTNTYSKDIIFEVTNVCNLQCPACPTMTTMNRTRGFMKFKLFKSAVDSLSVLHSKPRLYFNFSVETTLNRELVDFIAYAVRPGFRAHLSTNVSFLSLKDCWRQD